jgi:hypothetical protein
MSAEDFPELAAKDREADRAALLLETAAENVTDARVDQTYAERAQRLRGAAVIATSAALELMNAAGWYEAAATASAHGLLDSEEPSSSSHGRTDD